MNIEEKIWNFSNTGTKIHAFINGRTAACRESIARPAGSDMDFCEAKRGFKFSVCATCEKKFNAAIERLENSMKPSTGEGDCLPPAEEVAKTYNRLSDVEVGDIRYDSTRGWKYRVDHIKRSVSHGGSITVSGRCIEEYKDEATVAQCATSMGAWCYELAYNTAPEAEIEQEDEETMTDPKITPEVVQALAQLRRGKDSLVWQDAIDVLDNAGIFAAIDEATGYDVDPAPERVSKCICAAQYLDHNFHTGNCPGDPAEWGDMAYTTATAAENERLTREHAASLGRKKDRRPCPADQCTLDFAVNKDGTLHKHLNDMLEPCPGVAPVQVGSDEWMTAMGAALAETPLYALRKTDNEEN